MSNEFKTISYRGDTELKEEILSIFTNTKIEKGSITSGFVTDENEYRGPFWWIENKDQLGFPFEIKRLIEVIADALPPEWAEDFIEQILVSIEPGRDLSIVFHKFVFALLINRQRGIIDLVDEKNQRLIHSLAELHFGKNQLDSGIDSAFGGLYQVEGLDFLEITNLESNLKDSVAEKWKLISNSISEAFRNCDTLSEKMALKAAESATFHYWMTSENRNDIADAIARGSDYERIDEIRDFISFACRAYTTKHTIEDRKDWKSIWSYYWIEKGKELFTTMTMFCRSLLLLSISGKVDLMYNGIRHEYFKATWNSDDDTLVDLEIDVFFKSDDPNNILEYSYLANPKCTIEKGVIAKLLTDKFFFTHEA